MKYELVLQWPASSVRDYDNMIEIENVLSQTLSNHSQVEGHDAGSGEMNIFIDTDDPVAAFQEIRAKIGTHDFWSDARVAYRDAEDLNYIILWPKDLKEFKVI